MSQNHNPLNLLYSFLLPVLLSVALLVTSAMLGLVKLNNLLLAALLFATIGLSVFLAELMIARFGRVSERQETYALISSLLLNERMKDVANVLSQDEVLAIETVADEVWIYAYDLAWEGKDSVFSNLVLTNLQRGAKYRYIVPKNPQVHLRVNMLRHKYNAVRNLDRSIKYRSRPRDIKLIQFGITIYNPSVLGRNKHTDCIVVFFPHYRSFGEQSGNAPFITMRGLSTVEIQEGFLELWNESEDVAFVDGASM